MKRPARFAIVGIVVAVLLALVVLGGLAFRWAGAKARADELLTLSAAGKPVMPADLGRADDGRPEPTPWLGRLVAAKAPWAPTDLAHPVTYDSLRERARRSELGANVEAAFARLETCVAEQSGAVTPSSAVQSVLDVIAAHDGIVEPPRCGIEAAELLALGAATHVEVARLGRDYAPIDTTVVAAALDSTGELLPRLPIEQAVAASDALEIELLRALWTERYDAVPDLLRAQGDVARIFGGAQLLVGALASTIARQRQLGMLELALSRLPRDTDLAWLEAELVAILPRERLAAAAAGECAFGNRVFERLRAGGAQTLGLRTTLPATWTISYDQAEHVRAWRERIDRLGKPAYRRPPATGPGLFARELAPLTHQMSALPDNTFATADVLEARLVLARAALVAFRAGAKDVLEFVAKTSDPFDGRPIRAGFGENDVVLLWSVGIDGTDDGGLDDERDVVWRLRLR